MNNKKRHTYFFNGIRIRIYWIMYKMVIIGNETKVSKCNVITLYFIMKHYAVIRKIRGGVWWFGYFVDLFIQKVEAEKL